MFLLRDIPGQIVALVEEYNSMECTDERRLEIEAQIETLDGNFAALCQHLASLKASYEMHGLAYAEEIKRLEEKFLHAKKKADWLGQYIAGCFRSKGLEKLNTELYNFSFRKSSAVVVTSLYELPDEYKRVKTTTEPDKKLLGEAFKQGQIIPGAYVEERKNLQIK